MTCRRARTVVRVFAAIALLFVIVGVVDRLWFSAIVDGVLFVILCVLSRTLSWAIRLSDRSAA